MKEVICLQFGQGGCRLGHKFWSDVAAEHGIEAGTGLFSGDQSVQYDRLPVFFQECNARFVPRTLFIDSDPVSLNEIANTTWGTNYNPEHFVPGRAGAGNNWAKGYFGHASHLAEPAVERTRKLVELCEGFTGFMMTHSLGGGTGSGLFSLVSTTLRDQFADRLFSTVSLFPCEKISDVVVEPYNTILTMSRLLENIDQTFCFENETLFRICYEKLLVKEPTFEDFNSLASLVSCGLTSSCRFPGQLNIDLRTILINLCPFPRLHFIANSFGPIFSTNSQDYVQMGIRSLSQQCFDSAYMMTPTDTSRQFLSTVITYRGANICSQEIEDEACRIQSQYSESFVDFIPNAIKHGMVNVPHTGFETTATLMGNHLGIFPWFRRINQNFLTLYKASAFVHWYTKEGLEESAFSECSAVVMDCLDEVLQYGPEDQQVAAADDEE